MKKFNVLDLFSGAGGFSCGLDSLENFRTVVATDLDKHALSTFKNNFPHTKCILGDISSSEIKREIVKNALELEVNMIIGGPPCQGFSLKGKNLGLNDPRNFLFLEYLDIVDKIKPEIVIIENVKNMINSSKGFFIREIILRLEKLGYKTSYGILSAHCFGVPQKRERAIVIAYKGRKIIPLPFSENKKILTVRDAISDLSYLNSGEGKFEDYYQMDSQSEYQKRMRKNNRTIYNHIATNHSQIALEKLSLIPPEGDKSSLPKELHGNQKFSTTWARLEWDQPSPTIDTRFDTPSNGKNSHPYLNRAITPREAARIQSFPDDFIFFGPKTSICKQIGNAVPPLLARAIGEHIEKELYDE
ncbi:DNA cytosine methyltransferase [Avibacterium avium]